MMAQMIDNSFISERATIITMAAMYLINRLVVL